MQGEKRDSCNMVWIRAQPCPTTHLPMLMVTSSASMRLCTYMYIHVGENLKISHTEQDSGWIMCTSRPHLLPHPQYSSNSSRDHTHIFKATPTFILPCLGWSPLPLKRPGGSVLKLPIFCLGRESEQEKCIQKVKVVADNTSIYILNFEICHRACCTDEAILLNDIHELKPQYIQTHTAVSDNYRERGDNQRHEV